VSFSNDDVFRFVSRVSSNGVEGSLVIAALYYYTQIKPKLFDTNLVKMTFLITVAFIARSSSLVPWIPLALFKILENLNFFLPILVAGICVTIPMCVVSILLDSYFYGVLTVPQINFVQFNVVENISKYFGI
jgi:GPI mannosyltransferase 3